MNEQNYDSQSYSQPDQQANKGQFRQQILLQYYRYLNLLKKTNNFCKDFNVYKGISDHEFEDLALVGWVFEIENLKIKSEDDGLEQQCLSPVIYSNIKQPFRNYIQNPIKSASTLTVHNQGDTNNKRLLNTNQKQGSTCGSNTDNQLVKHSIQLQPHIRRPLLLLKAIYLRYFIKAFNQVLKQCKQFRKYFVIQSSTNNTTTTTNVNNVFNQIEWIYAFTGLKLAFQSGKLCFIVTEKTKIIALDTKYYTQTIQHLQKSIGFPYSYFTLTQKTYDCNSIQEGYSLNALQIQASVIDKLSFTGVLKEKVVDEKNNNKKDKQLLLVFYEDSLYPHKQMIGQAKVVIKYSFQENEKNLLSYFKIGYIYLVTNAIIEINDNVNIIFKLKQGWKDNIFQINIQKPTQLTPKIINQLPIVDMSWLKLANVNRNIIKVKVDLYRCQHLFGKIICTNCKAIINNQGFCSRYCGQNEGELILWTIALVNDSSTYAEISMEKNQTIQFFDFTPEQLQDIRKYILAQNSRKMVRLFDKFKHFSGGDSTEQLTSFQRVVGVKFVTKILIAIPRYNVNESFSNQLTEQEKQQFQQSLQSSKEYLKKNKVHFNGYVKKIQKDYRKAVPYLKVIQVL